MSTRSTAYVFFVLYSRIYCTLFAILNNVVAAIPSQTRRLICYLFPSWYRSGLLFMQFSCLTFTVLKLQSRSWKSFKET